MTIPRVLIIAGSDSGGGAGIQADIKTVTMFGGHAMTAVTAITAQNTLGVAAVVAVSAEGVIAQIDAVMDDIGADVVKIGMIGSAATAHAVADRLERMIDVPLILDPVMVATSGAVLADEETRGAYARLMRRATLVTPNAPELAVLSGLVVAGVADLRGAALQLVRDFGCAVLAKGGHLPGDDLVDVLVTEDGSIGRWEGTRIATRHSHGTGCTLASGIAVCVAQGRSLTDAIGQARDYVRAALLAAPGLGNGHGPLGHALGVVPIAVIGSARGN